MQALWTAVGRRERQAPKKLDPQAFGLTCGMMWSIGLFSLTWWIIAFDGPSREPTGIGKLYRGYTITPAGSIIGLVWAFFDALTGGVCFAWLYNYLIERHQSE
jgi:hypothetical protein